jgi:hypothetical protein
MIAFIRLFASDQMRAEERNCRAEVLLREVEELRSWLCDPQLQATSDELQREIDAWTASYVGAGGKDVGRFVQSTTKIWTRKPRGYPVEVRKVAIRGLEIKLANPGLNWDEVAEKVWPTDRNVNSPGQCLRQEVIALRKVLKKFGLPGSAPFERHAGKSAQPKTRPTHV